MAACSWRNVTLRVLGRMRIIICNPSFMQKLVFSLLSFQKSATAENCPPAAHRTSHELAGGSLPSVFQGFCYAPNYQSSSFPLERGEKPSSGVPRPTGVLEGKSCMLYPKELGLGWERGSLILLPEAIAGFWRLYHKSKVSQSKGTMRFITFISTSLLPSSART